MLSLAMNHPWLILAAPLQSALVSGLLLRPRFPGLAAFWGTASAFAALLLSLFVAAGHLAHPQATLPFAFEWLRFGPQLTAEFGVVIDSLSVLMLVVVTLVSALVHLYSVGYMHGDPGKARFFAYLGLFTFSMLGLVVAPGLVQIYVFWELVGVSSFLLIGFYFVKPEAVAASKKAFIVTRFADLGFLLGILLLGAHASVFPPGAEVFRFSSLTAPNVLELVAGAKVAGTELPLLATALILIFAGAAGKSAMFPLHIWLPDAMEGPTPVSALIHAATMVVAGVFLVARLFPAFAAAGTPLELVAWVGLFTSLFAALIACTQDDIKRVLAYSTLSQLGYMMFALGVASMAHPLGYTASLFHLFTHAFFKALLFLGAGSLIHAVHSNSVRDMGGLARRMPVTHASFLVAVLAIAGIYPFAGFFSKDEILAATLAGGRPLFFGVGLLVAGLTAFYMTRIYVLAFLGPPRSPQAGHAHESPPVMLLPLLVLAALSVLAGFAPFGHWLHLHEEPHGGIDPVIAIPATLVALGGMGTAWFFYRGNAEGAASAARSLGSLYETIRNKFYVDELYLFVVHRLIFPLVASPIAWFDRHVVDGAVNLSGWLTRKCGELGALLQTGQAQTYGAWLVAGIGGLLWFAIHLAGGAR